MLQNPKHLRNNREAQNELTTLLKQTFLIQKGYGEKPEDAATRDAGFQELLGDYEIEEIRAAFREYLQTEPDLPTPANIIKIMKKQKETPIEISDEERYQRLKFIKEVARQPLDASQWSFYVNYERCQNQQKGVIYGD